MGLGLVGKGRWLETRQWTGKQALEKAMVHSRRRGGSPTQKFGTGVVE